MKCKYRVELFDGNKLVFAKDEINAIELRRAMRKYINHKNLFPYIVTKEVDRVGYLFKSCKISKKGYRIERMD